MESGIPIEETNDDSDSSEKSWVLVDENPSENSQNTFVLNCNREPILELTQEDLGAEASDEEFDLIEQDRSSDGISVISEEEIDLDCPIEEKLIETLTSDSKNRVYVHSSNNRINNILNTALAVSFITALSLGLGHYIGSTFDCSLNTIIDVDKLHDENEALKSRLSMLQNDRYQSEQNGAAEHCTMSDNLDSLQDLIKDVENKEVVSSDNINNDPVKNIQPDTIETKESVPETEGIVIQKKARKDKSEDKKQNKSKRRIKEKKKELKYKNEYDDDDDDEIDDRTKKWKKQNKLNGREEYDDQFKKWKRERKPLDVEFENTDENDDYDDDKKFKKQKKEKKKNYKDGYKKSTNGKYGSRVNKNGEDRKKGEKFFVNGKLNYTENVNGEWMERLAEARKEYRQNTKRGEWVFDRANGRKNLRNKAKWYFDRMWDRQVYRQQSL